MEPITIKFGEVTANEINTMLTASAESDEAIAQAILDKQNGRTFGPLNKEEAGYLRDNLLGDADRVAQGVGTAAGVGLRTGRG